MKFVVLTLILSALASAQQAGIVARISEHPPLGPEELARLEAKVLAQPSDLDLRVRLLTYYRDFASPASRLQRLKHILYIIENQPENPVAASQLTYIGTATGPIRQCVRPRDRQSRMAPRGGRQSRKSESAPECRTLSLRRTSRTG